MGEVAVERQRSRMLATLRPPWAGERNRWALLPEAAERQVPGRCADQVARNLGAGAIWKKKLDWAGRAKSEAGDIWRNASFGEKMSKNQFSIEILVCKF